MNSPLFHLLEGVPKPVAPYSHAVQLGSWLFVTGQIPNDPVEDSKPLPIGIADQTRQVMGNLNLVLAGVGYDLSHVLSARVFLTNFQGDYEAMNEVYRSYFPTDRLPARTCIGVTGLARDALIEIDFIAYKE